MKLWAGVAELLFPTKCPFCRTLLENPDGLLCPDCQQSLPWLIGPAGERQVEFTEGCFAPLAYRDRVPEAIHRYKFSGVRAYAGPFGALVAQCIQDHLQEKPDGLTWAPISRRRLRERGFDQGELIARRAGEVLGLPVIPTLKKIRHTQAQSGLESKEDRRSNIQGCYTLLPGAPVAGKRLVLIDDVVTSGSTLGECAKVLTLGGVKQVWCAALANAGSGEK